MAEPLWRVGIDVGGSSVRAARVDVATGELGSEVARVDLPQPATPDRVIEAALSLDPVRTARAPIGMAVPSVVQRGVTRTAANIDAAWIGCDVGALLAARCGGRCALLNDADAAGLAEMRLGAGRDRLGLVFVLTLGSGIGSAPFVDGRLWPNTELGHLVLPGSAGLEGEQWASARTRTRESLDWPAWGARVGDYLRELHRLFWPDAFILGGAVSESFELWQPYLQVPASVVPARFRGAAGLVGAALAVT
jgi:polyphosphate glucokinase